MKLPKILPKHANNYMRGGGNYMLYISDDNVIRLTRGDTAAITVNIVDDVTSVEYKMSSTDILTLSCKKSVKDSEYCFQKSVTGINKITIEPSDTCNMEFGKYKYDIQLTKDTGAVSTIIEPTMLEILPEVTC